MGLFEVVGTGKGEAGCGQMTITNFPSGTVPTTTDLEL
jgi:hypothetical protein